MLESINWRKNLILDSIFFSDDFESLRLKAFETTSRILPKAINENQMLKKPHTCFKLNFPYSKIQFQRDRKRVLHMSKCNDFPNPRKSGISHMPHRIIPESRTQNSNTLQQSTPQSRFPKILYNSITRRHQTQMSPSIRKKEKKVILLHFWYTKIACETSKQ